MCEQHLTDEATAAYLTSAFWGAFTVGRLLGIPLATRFQPQVVVLISIVGALFFSGLLIYDLDNLWFTWVASIGLGLSMAPVFPNVISFAGRHLHITGKITGWFFVGASVGGMVLPWLNGQFIDRIGPWAMPYSVLVTLVLAALMIGLLLLRAHRRSQSEPVL